MKQKDKQAGLTKPVQRTSRAGPCDSGWVELVEGFPDETWKRKPKVQRVQIHFKGVRDKNRLLLPLQSLPPDITPRSTTKIALSTALWTGPRKQRMVVVSVMSPGDVFRGVKTDVEQYVFNLQPGSKLHNLH